MVRKYKRYHVMCALVLGLMMVVPATAKLDLSDDDCSLHTDQLADCVKQPFITICAIETRTQGDNGMLGWDYRFPFAEGYGIAATNTTSGCSHFGSIVEGFSMSRACSRIL